MNTWKINLVEEPYIYRNTYTVSSKVSSHAKNQPSFIRITEHMGNEFNGYSSSTEHCSIAGGLELNTSVEVEDSAS